ncbi:MAG: hypothetical protein GY791_20150 [Alphaproteobacteria bacterium]|nr:hypothetical protein [Alphaproteobacteria bacterium]
MRFRERADATVKSIAGGLNLDLSDSQVKQMTDIVEQAIIDEAREERERCATVAHHCCREDMDLAHKTARTIREANEALITNLMAMR